MRVNSGCCDYFGLYVTLRCHLHISFGNFLPVLLALETGPFPVSDEIQFSDY